MDKETFVLIENIVGEGHVRWDPRGPIVHEWENDENERYGAL